MSRFIFVVCVLLWTMPTLSAAEKQTSPKPFDLNLLPRGIDQGIIGIRPAKLMPQFGTKQPMISELFLQSLSASLTFLKIDYDLQAGNLMAATELEQVVFSLSPKVDLRAGENNSSIGTGGSLSTGYVMTKNKFDWAAWLKKCFRSISEVKYAGQTYFQLKVGLQAAEGGFYLYCPDEYTVVVDNDSDNIESLIDRVQSKKKLPSPEGWDDVCHHDVILVLPMGDRSWLSHEKNLNDHGKLIVEVTEKLDSLFVGLSSGEKSELRVVMNCEDEQKAKDLEKIAERVMGLYQKGFSNDALAAQVKLKSKRSGAMLTLVGSIGINLISYVMSSEL